MSSIEDLKQKAAVFRDMHFGDTMVLLPNAWDHASAALMVEAGFPVIATTSAGIALARGYPDGEIMSRDAMLGICAGIARQSSVPVTADLEAGYGPGPEDVAATVAGAIEAGLVGCNIEDASPETRTLFELDEAVERIRAGRAAADRLGVPFVLNARADPYLKSVGDAEANFQEAVRRCNAYLAAGATCVYVPGPGDAETVGRLVKAVNGPLNILGSLAGRPGLTVQRYHDLGVRRISIGGSLMLAAATFTRDAVVAMRDQGALDFAEAAMTNRSMNQLMSRLHAVKD
jgi:2-methylisocitrate lyase-like PEP mutase family enzyme